MIPVANWQDMQHRAWMEEQAWLYDPHKKGAEYFKERAHGLLESLIHHNITISDTVNMLDNLRVEVTCKIADAIKEKERQEAEFSAAIKRKHNKDGDNEQDK